MKAGFYPKLAWNGIRKNGRLYFPYLLTGIGMVMMYYIVSYLSTSEALNVIPGGNVMEMILGFGCGVIAIFTAIFLFYTNSFLIRRRKKEYGLYNILGMGKWNLVRIQVWESVITAVVALSGGLLCGILFSKLAELCMQNVLKGDVSISFTVSVSSVYDTIRLFLAIFLLIFISSAAQIHVANPIELLHSENAGEKRPRANWLIAVLGLGILVLAYYIAVSIEEPVSALVWFFAAVVMVIVATYLLFLAGSVVICRILQKNRRFYYKTRHFVSVSSMAYRMKRNGAGLASICILSTMVLVMISSTACLYIGAEDNLHQRYVRDIVTDLYSSDPAKIADMRNEIDAVLQAHGQEPENIMEYDVINLAGYFDGSHVITNPSSMDNFELSTYDHVRYMYFVPIEDYNRLMGKNEHLEPGEVIVYPVNDSFSEDSIDLDVYGELTVKKQADSYIDDGESMISIVSSLYVFTPDYEMLEEKLGTLCDDAENQLAHPNHYYGFDLSCSDEKQIAVYQDIYQALRSAESALAGETVTVESLAEARGDTYILYGGLFFLGIALGIVFLTATVLIMYYKQISEGYEDQARFTIMQKVGMTKKEIRQSINSQILMVFFLPLVTAGIHLAFAFPLISKMLALFACRNTTLLIIVTAICYLVFALFYMIVYRITSRSYYHIVSSSEE